MESGSQSEPPRLSISIPKPNHLNYTKPAQLRVGDESLSTQLPPIGNSPPTPNFFRNYADKYLSTRQFTLTKHNYNNYLSSTR